MIREKSGLLEREKEKFAVEEQAKFAAEQAAQRREVHRDSTAPRSDFSIDSPRNPDPRKK